jgi:hypothetical protein
MGHIHSRDSARMRPDPCAQPVSRFPQQAYMSVALHHLFQWVDKGTVPPRSTRIWKDRDESDGSAMVLDELGNPRGGVRNRRTRELVFSARTLDPAPATATSTRRRGSAVSPGIAAAPASLSSASTWPTLP